MLNKEEKDRIKKIFFIDKNTIYQFALSLDSTDEIPLSVIEELFFRQDFTNQFSPVEFCEFYNQEKKWINNWFQELGSIQDQQDWLYYQSKMVSHFNRIAPIDSGHNLRMANEKTRLFYYINRWNNWLSDLKKTTAPKKKEIKKEHWIFWKFLNICLDKKESEIIDYLQENKNIDFYKIFETYKNQILLGNKENQVIITKLESIIKSYSTYFELNNHLTIKEKIQKILKI
jgi:hypothetical protein